uniref:Uncharacterized protein n=1 Tax=Rhizochromulina marina TaxID=1034831 RepID=A0A7S2S8K3_9STRA
MDDLCLHQLPRWGRAGLFRDDTALGEACPVGAAAWCSWSPGAVEEEEKEYFSAPRRTPSTETDTRHGGGCPEPLVLPPALTLHQRPRTPLSGVGRQDCPPVLAIQRPACFLPLADTSPLWVLGAEGQGGDPLEEEEEMCFFSAPVERGRRGAEELAGRSGKRRRIDEAGMGEVDGALPPAFAFGPEHHPSMSFSFSSAPFMVMASHQ